MEETQIEKRKKLLIDRTNMYAKSLHEGVVEHMQTLDEYYKDMRELEELEYGMRPPFVSAYLALPKGMVVLSGGDLPLIEDYIDEKCQLVVTEEAFNAASKAQM